MSVSLQGVSTQAIFDPVYWTPDRQRAAFRRAVATIGEHVKVDVS